MRYLPSAAAAISMFVTCCATAQSWGPETSDLDSDGIPDNKETQLLQQCAPIIILDTQRSAPQSGVGIPSTVTRLIQHAVFREPFDPTKPLVEFRFLSVPEAVSFMLGRSDRGLSLRARHIDGDYRWGYSNLPGGASSWPIAISRNDGL